MAAAGYPQPPGVVRQQSAPPQQEESAFAAPPGGQGQGQDPAAENLQQIVGTLKELDQVVSKLKTLLDGYDKSLSVFLQPMAQAGVQLEQALTEKAQRSGVGRGSPTLVPSGQGAAAGVPSPRGV